MVAVCLRGRRFLDAQRIHNLTSYLELLHDKVWKGGWAIALAWQDSAFQHVSARFPFLNPMLLQGLASADHTTLLLNCYTRLKDVAKLDAFCARRWACMA